MGLLGLGLPELLMISILVLVVILHGKVIMRVWHREATTIAKALWTLVIAGIPFVGSKLGGLHGSSRI
jgi:hypothetical protein